MNKTTQRTCIAAAVLALASTCAFAQSHEDDTYVSLANDTAITQTVGVYGEVGIGGYAMVNTSVGAVVDNRQASNLAGTVLVAPDHSYTVSNTVAQGYTQNSYANGFGGGSQSSWGQSSYTNNTSNYGSSGQTSYYGSSTQASANAGFGASYIAGGSLNSQTSTTTSSGNNGGWDWFGGYINPTSSWSNTSKSASYQANGYVQGTAGAFLNANVANETHSGSAWGSNNSFNENTSASQNGGYAWSQYAYGTAGGSSFSGYTLTHTVIGDLPTLSASVGTDALINAAGNIGVNVASGADNAQSNEAALSSIDSGAVFGNAQVFSTQASGGAGVLDGFNVAATLDTGALAGAQGNIGVNIASGLGNVQNNSLAASTTAIGSGATAAVANAAQFADAQVVGSFTPTASLESGALAGAAGNVGVNLAAGAGNVQHNGLALASVSGSALAGIGPR